MFYNRILRVWVVDQLDVFLISLVIGISTASYLKDYLSETKSMQRLKNSMIKKSKSISESKRTISNFKRRRIKKISRFALDNRGGQFENLQLDPKVSDEVFKLALKIKELTERLACFLKQRELQGVAKFFFRNGRLILELVLYKSNITITYASLLAEGLSAQTIVITATTGGATGFVLGWLTVGATVVVPPLLAFFFVLRSAVQQIFNQWEYAKYVDLLDRMLEDERIKESIKAIMVEGKVLPRSSSIEMRPFESNKNPLPEFDLKPDQTLEEFLEETFLKKTIERDFGLVENPSQEQLEKITKRIRKPKGKTVYFGEFIDKIAENPENILDAEIINKPIRGRIRNPEL